MKFKQLIESGTTLVPLTGIEPATLVFAKATLIH